MTGMSGPTSTVLEQLRTLFRASFCLSVLLLAACSGGGADVTASGVAVALSVDASGGSDVDLRLLSAESVEVDASGGADVTITATERVTGSASGGSDVSVHGDPASKREAALRFGTNIVHWALTN